MKRPVFLLSLLCTVLLAACAVVTPTPAPVRVMTASADASIDYALDGEVLFIDVVSPSGTGKAALSLPASAIPRSIVLRLHLQGLEHFVFAYDDVKVMAEVPGQAATAAQQEARQGPDAAPEQLSPDSPLWLDIRRVQPDAGEDGYYEVTAPAAFFQSGVRDFSIEWVDFYR
ncbi:MAG: hypothetical protein D6791_16930 [Chloroflexi bacterium]|nr:MAG: hypothetical protein D6791_16930 [Chloroflexota bacterium]